MPPDYLLHPKIEDFTDPSGSDVDQTLDAFIAVTEQRADWCEAHGIADMDAVFGAGPPRFRRRDS